MASNNGNNISLLEVIQRLSGISISDLNKVKKNPKKISKALKSDVRNFLHMANSYITSLVSKPNDVKEEAKESKRNDIVDPGPAVTADVRENISTISKKSEEVLTKLDLISEICQIDEIGIPKNENEKRDMGTHLTILWQGINSERWELGKQKIIDICDVLQNPDSIPKDIIKAFNQLGQFIRDNQKADEVDFIMYFVGQLDNLIKRKTGKAGVQESVIQLDFESKEMSLPPLEFVKYINSAITTGINARTKESAKVLENISNGLNLFVNLLCKNDIASVTTDKDKAGAEQFKSVIQNFILPQKKSQRGSIHGRGGVYQNVGKINYINPLPAVLTEQEKAANRFVENVNNLPRLINASEGVSITKAISEVSAYLNQFIDFGDAKREKYEATIPLAITKELPKNIKQHSLISLVQMITDNDNQNYFRQNDIKHIEKLFYHNDFCQRLLIGLNASESQGAQGLMLIQQMQAIVNAQTESSDRYNLIYFILDALNIYVHKTLRNLSSSSGFEIEIKALSVIRAQFELGAAEAYKGINAILSSNDKDIKKVSNIIGNKLRSFRYDFPGAVSEDKKNKIIQHSDVAELINKFPKGFDNIHLLNGLKRKLLLSTNKDGSETLSEEGKKYLIYVLKKTLFLREFRAGEIKYNKSSDSSSSHYNDHVFNIDIPVPEPDIVKGDLLLQNQFEATLLALEFHPKEFDKQERRIIFRSLLAIMLYDPAKYKTRIQDSIELKEMSSRLGKSIYLAEFKEYQNEWNDFLSSSFSALEGKISDDLLKKIKHFVARVEGGVEEKEDKDEKETKDEKEITDEAGKINVIAAPRSSAIEQKDRREVIIALAKIRDDNYIENLFTDSETKETNHIIKILKEINASRYVEDTEEVKNDTRPVEVRDDDSPLNLLADNILNKNLQFRLAKKLIDNVKSKDLSSEEKNVVADSLLSIWINVNPNAGLNQYQAFTNEFKFAEILPTAEVKFDENTKVRTAVFRLGAADAATREINSVINKIFELLETDAAVAVAKLPDRLDFKLDPSPEVSKVNLTQHYLLPDPRARKEKIESLLAEIPNLEARYSNIDFNIALAEVGVKKQLEIKYQKLKACLAGLTNELETLHANRATEFIEYFGVQTHSNAVNKMISSIKANKPVTDYNAILGLFYWSLTGYNNNNLPPYISQDVLINWVITSLKYNNQSGEVVIQLNELLANKAIFSRLFFGRGDPKEVKHKPKLEENGKKLAEAIFMSGLLNDDLVKISKNDIAADVGQGLEYKDEKEITHLSNLKEMIYNKLCETGYKSNVLEMKWLRIAEHLKTLDELENEANKDPVEIAKVKGYTTRLIKENIFLLANNKTDLPPWITQESLLNLTKYYPDLMPQCLAKNPTKILDRMLKGDSTPQSLQLGKDELYKLFAVKPNPIIAARLFAEYATDLAALAEGDSKAPILYQKTLVTLFACPDWRELIVDYKDQFNQLKLYVDQINNKYIQMGFDGNHAWLKVNMIFNGEYTNPISTDMDKRLDPQVTLNAIRDASLHIEHANQRLLNVDKALKHAVKDIKKKLQATPEGKEPEEDKDFDTALDNIISQVHLAMNNAVINVNTANSIYADEKKLTDILKSAIQLDKTPGEIKNEFKEAGLHINVDAFANQIAALNNEVEELKIKNKNNVSIAIKEAKTTVLKLLYNDIISPELLNDEIKFAPFDDAHSYTKLGVNILAAFDRLAAELNKEVVLFKNLRDSEFTDTNKLKKHLMNLYRGGPFVNPGEENGYLHKIFSARAGNLSDNPAFIFKNVILAAIIDEDNAKLRYPEIMRETVGAALKAKNVALKNEITAEESKEFKEYGSRLDQIFQDLNGCVKDSAADLKNKNEDVFSTDEKFIGVLDKAFAKGCAAEIEAKEAKTYIANISADLADLKIDSVKSNEIAEKIYEFNRYKVEANKVQKVNNVELAVNNAKRQILQYYNQNRPLDKELVQLDILNDLFFNFAEALKKKARVYANRDHYQNPADIERMLVEPFKQGNFANLNVIALNDAKAVSSFTKRVKNLDAKLKNEIVETAIDGAIRRKPEFALAYKELSFAAKLNKLIVAKRLKRVLSAASHYFRAGDTQYSYNPAKKASVLQTILAEVFDQATRNDMINVLNRTRVNDVSAGFAEEFVDVVIASNKEIKQAIATDALDNARNVVKNQDKYKSVPDQKDFNQKFTIVFDKLEAAVSAQAADYANLKNPNLANYAGLSAILIAAFNKNSQNEIKLELDKIINDAVTANAIANEIHDFNKRLVNLIVIKQERDHADEVAERAYLNHIRKLQHDATLNRAAREETRAWFDWKNDMKYPSHADDKVPTDEQDYKQVMLPNNVQRAFISNDEFKRYAKDTQPIITASNPRQDPISYRLRNGDVALNYIVNPAKPNEIKGLYSERIEKESKGAKTKEEYELTVHEMPVDKQELLMSALLSAGVKQADAKKVCREFDMFPPYDASSMEQYLASKLPDYNVSKLRVDIRGKRMELSEYITNVYKQICKDYIEFVDKPCSSFLAELGFGQSMYIRPNSDTLLVKSFILMCEVKGIKCINMSGVSYSPDARMVQDMRDSNQYQSVATSTDVKAEQKELEGIHARIKGYKEATPDDVMHVKHLDTLLKKLGSGDVRSRFDEVKTDVTNIADRRKKH